jgi:hypothetical protein
MADQKPSHARQERLQARLWRHAVGACLPHLLELDALQPFRDSLSLVVVGSVATGMCDADSDIDIAAIASDRTYAALRSSAPEEWARKWESGRPLSARVEGESLHWYVTRLSGLRMALQCHNDSAMYHYGIARVLSDPRGRFGRVLAEHGPDAEGVRRARTEGKLDMLMRRTRILDAVQRDGRVALATVTLEVIRLGLKTVALLDGVHANPRKHLESTALRGPIGASLRPGFLEALRGMAILGEDGPVAKRDVIRQLRKPMQHVTDELRGAARASGFTVGLAKPDPRHGEPQPDPKALWKRRAEWQHR